jgi:hypothetical protein
MTGLCPVITSFAQAPPQPGGSFPQAAISNGVLFARFYLPDTAAGYYRATRFDWSGVLPELTYKGHSFTGQWFPKYDPLINDAIMGPVESFVPIPAGDRFVHIGVGVLNNPASKPWSPFKLYPILNPGRWTTKTKKASIEFRQQLSDPAGSYTYTKRISLNKNSLTVYHSLKNTGRTSIETDVFNHNFFLIDTSSTAPGASLKFGFRLTATEARGLDSLAALQDDSITILRPLRDKQSVYAVLHGYGDSPKDYDITVVHRPAGAGIRITADRPLSKLVFWGNPKNLCPEPYIHIKAAPGETFTWTIRYELYTLNNAK